MTTSLQTDPLAPFTVMPDDARPLWGSLLSVLTSCKDDYALFEVVLQKDLLNILAFLRERLEAMETDDDRYEVSSGLYACLVKDAIDSGHLNEGYLRTYPLS